jgi:hypothetical protein
LPLSEQRVAQQQPKPAAINRRAASVPAGRGAQSAGSSKQQCHREQYRGGGAAEHDRVR